MVNASFLLLLATAKQPANGNNIVPPAAPVGASSPSSSRWSHRTAKRRERTEQVIQSVERQLGGDFSPLSVAIANTNHQDDDVPTLLASEIDWTSIDPALDPIKGGKLRPDSARGARKRSQVEAFVTVLSSLLSATAHRRSNDRNSEHGTTIIDAGSGAGNLAIALAGLVLTNANTKHGGGEGGENSVNVLAVDVNDHALRRLAERADAIPILRPGSVQTLCADIADVRGILAHIPTTNRDVIVVSLHACGAASDMAMNLAFECGAPFVICPCCTAKSLTKRADEKKSNDGPDAAVDVEFDPSASFKRSGATADIEYPRSDWLKKAFMSIDIDVKYSILAKVADVGLGPQTPSEQREQQRRAKKIIELDRLVAASERHGYEVRLLRIQDHDPLLYGKGDLLLGAKQGSVEANVLMNLPVLLKKG
jgi:hypothetical protein